MRFERYAQVSCQSVARTTWDDAEGRIRMNYRAGHLIDCAVASHSHDDIDMLLYTLPCDVSSMSSKFGKDHLMTELLFVESAVNQRRHLHFAVSARMRVKDEYNSFLFVHFSAKIL